MTIQLKDGVALVTGAASGIGRSTALALAARGCHLALLDRNESGLKETAQLVQAQPIRISQHVVDLSNSAAIMTLPEQVLSAHPRINILINNAGVALVGSFSELTLEEYRWLIEINFLAVVGMTKAFLPILLNQSQAQIVNLSSVFGIIAPPYQTAYAAAKFAVRGFSEALRHELVGSSVGVTVVHPGGVKTNIALGARIAAAADQVAAAEGAKAFTQSLRLGPDRAAAQIVQAIEKRSQRLLIGNDARLIDSVQRLFPVSYWKIFSRLI
ncbi:MAG: SDR family NAD(P)-dependent oxidoreductase [Caldilineaceae bacterium]